MLDDVISADSSPSLQEAAALQTPPETVAFIRREDRYNLLTFMVDKPVRDFDDLLREAEPADLLIDVQGSGFKEEGDKNYKDDADKSNKDQKDQIDSDTGKESSDKDPKEASDKTNDKGDDKPPDKAPDSGGVDESLLRSFALKNDNGLVDPGPADTVL